MTMPEMARLLMITRDQVYNILNQKRNKWIRSWKNTALPNMTDMNCCGKMGADCPLIPMNSSAWILSTAKGDEKVSFEKWNRGGRESKSSRKNTETFV